jgi:hypothetical protein
LEPVTENYECSGDPSARGSPSSELSAGEQFETPAKEAVSFEFINPAYVDDDMPILADPPVFYGESGRDDLEKYAHELDAWWFSCKSSSSTTSARLFEVLARRAFPYESAAAEWFAECKEVIMSTARTEGAGEDALLVETLGAIRERFGYLKGDGRKEGESVELKAGEDVAAFAMRFRRMVKEAGISEKMAKSHLLRAVTKNCPQLARELEHQLLDGTVTFEACVKLAQKYLVFKSMMQDVTHAKASSTSSKAEESNKVVYVLSGYARLTI